VASDLQDAVARANRAFDRAEAELEAEVIAGAGGGAVTRAAPALAAMPGAGA
jgi:hypothetical protein